MISKTLRTLFWLQFSVQAVKAVRRTVRAYARYQSLGYCQMRRRLRLQSEMWETSRVHGDIAHAVVSFQYADGQSSPHTKILCAAPHDGKLCPAAASNEVYTLQMQRQTLSDALAESNRAREVNHELAQRLAVQNADLAEQLNEAEMALLELRAQQAQGHAAG